jgi:hypothetical protein
MPRKTLADTLAARETIYVNCGHPMCCRSTKLDIQARFAPVRKFRFGGRHCTAALRHASLSTKWLIMGVSSCPFAGLR